MSVTTEARLVPVVFVKGITLYRDGTQHSYAAGERAGFDPDYTLWLIESGAVQRVTSASHPLVGAAVTHPDPEIRRLATALQDHVRPLAELEALAGRLRADVITSQKMDEVTSARGTAQDPAHTATRQSRLEEVERKIDTLLSRDASVFEDLKAKVTVGYQRQADGIIADLAPVLRSLTDMARKAQTMFEVVTTKRAELAAVRSAAACAELETQIIDQRLERATGLTEMPATLADLFSLLTQKEARR